MNITTQITDLVKKSTTEILIAKTKELFGNLKLTSLYVEVVGELENRIGEDATDLIIAKLRAN